MPRRPRLSIAGIPWHVIQRGHNRQNCFHREDDYYYYLDTLHEQARKHGCDVHAYVLMTNHVHLLLTPASKNSASQMMKHLDQRYAQYINRHYHRSGTLWEGRFRSCLVQKENYVLFCYRYIELNPVRAGMVNRPSAYPWSSHAANAHGAFNPLVTPHDLYLGLGINNADRQKFYRALVMSQLNEYEVGDIRKATNGNLALR